MRVLTAAAALLLLAPLASAQHRDTHRAPTYGEAELHEDHETTVVVRRSAPTYGEAPAGRTLVRSERIVTRYYDGGEARQRVAREPAPRWIRQEALAFRALPSPRTARRAHLDGVSYGDGSRYRGDVSRGLPHGHGRMTYADGSTYDGAFRDGAPDGVGTLQTASGDVFTGTFADGTLVSGSADYAAGHRYEGAFLAGRPHGQGTIDYADGASYEGAFQAGRPDGWGAYRSADGRRAEGTWARGRLDDGWHSARRTDRRMRHRGHRADDGAWR